MEAEFASKRDRIDGARLSNGHKKKGLEWDLNDWRWDGNLFLATPLNAAPSECANKELCQAQEEIDFGVVEKRRRISPTGDHEPCNEAGPLVLANGDHADMVAEADRNSQEERPRKGGSSTTRPSCQVDGCRADLSNARDYHRRHKVCEMHSKASMVLIKNTELRFCQQCSRFHLLQEFDEGKKSCRQRLASHNGRRRKSQPPASSSGTSLTDNHSVSYILLSLLKTLSGLESVNSSEQNNGLNPLVNLLKNLATLASSPVSRDNVRLVQASQDLQRNGTSAGTPSEAANAVANGFTAQEPSRPLSTVDTVPSSDRLLSSLAATVPPAEMPSDRCTTGAPFGQASFATPRKCATFGQVNTPSSIENDMCMVQSVLPEGPPAKTRLRDFDLNDSYVGEDQLQCRTDRIVFKLFGKEPNDFPVDLHSQILNWLSRCPGDMESYIRPGCIILTVYLRLPNWMWDELDHDLTPWMEKLMSMSIGGFWSTGWVYARVQDRMALICNGSIVLESPWRPRIDYRHQILWVAPIAVPCSSTASFSVEGFNLAQPTARLLCGFDGRYLVQETTRALVDDTCMEQGLQCLSFSCSVPGACGRGFIEVEDYDHSSLSFPFVVAEEDICSEIRMLENEINAFSCTNILEERTDLVDARNRALNFVQEVGWLLQRSHIRATSEQLQSCSEGFPVARFRWLVSFAVDREWCAVLKKLLDSLFQGNVAFDARSPVEYALGEDLLHTAVSKRSKPLVEFLLRYTSNTALKGTAPVRFLFTPDMIGPSNVTPLHIAATISDAEGVLDALTDDPQQLGIKAWKKARDVTGFTPEDYARNRGHISYIQMIQDKIDSTTPQAHVSVTIPISSLLEGDTAEKQSDGSKSSYQTTLHMDKSRHSKEQQLYCKQCVQRLACRPPRANGFLSTRPAVLSLIVIAAVCVCVGLIMHSPPNVGFAKRPFLWDALGSGSI